MSRYCEKSAHRMYSYLDKEITLVRRVRIRFHLRRCPPCAHGFDFEEQLKQRIRRANREEPSAELMDRLWTFLQQHGAGDESG
ncbi:MAG: zf-HC2 domain-containing protein [Actinobacteria bacterium]|nr:zf-HC2 domain-containing protein [Actinomycetota bacterium]